ncbi:MAG TPA: ATP-binding protein, partial [Acidimicrobiales bacterium]|nr:ATP-binding protein [Acidimicrobiales bacterium]
MLAKLKIRSRLLLLALVATIALAGSSGFVTDQLESRTGGGADAVLATLTEVNRAAVTVAADLQAESDAARRLLSGPGSPEVSADLTLRRESTNASLAQLGDAIAAVGGRRATQLAEAATSLSGVFDHRQAVDDGTAALAEVDAFAASARQGLTGLQGVSGAIAGDVVAADDSPTVAGMDVNLLAGAVGGLLMLVLALAVSRSITRPLRVLTEAAERGSKLPALVEALRRPTGQDKHLALAPVGLPPQGEVGRAAQAFDAFQGAAAKLAVSHAGMLNRSVAEKGTAEVFVNLARRMQSLVDHQIEFLDSLEAGEEDPDSLDDLFRLDQLATRVRRNAESLLSLAGSATVRSWERPLSMADVIRAGAAEVEDLSRIDVSVKDHFTMLGNVAADAAHLLSELLENGTRWSPPSTRVEVIGRPAPGGYEILVQDHGVGMSPQALAEANHVLTGPPVAGPTVARSLGLVVAGRLARRLGIEVRLSSAAPSGVTARVFVPSTLIVSTEAEAGEVEDMAGGRALPFALARQEKRARISSQRRRGPRGSRPAPVAPPAPAPDLPTVE